MKKKPTTTSSTLQLPRDLDKVLLSIVQVHTEDAIGSAFCVEERGILATNKHVVGTQPFVELRMHDQTVSIGQVLTAHPQLDLAFIRILGRSLPPLHCTDITTADIGQEIWVVGSPWGISETVTRGVVSNPERITEYRATVPYIQTDAAINPGNSGCPMMRANGQVGAMATWIRGDAQNIGFGLPVRFIINRMHKLLGYWENIDACCYCTTCGFMTFPPERWCTRCGSKVEANLLRLQRLGSLEPLRPGQVRCSACGHQIPENLRYCNHCGATLVPMPVSRPKHGR